MRTQPVTSKTCTVCKIVKPVEEFYLISRTTGGRQSLCRLCERDRQKSRRRNGLVPKLDIVEPTVAEKTCRDCKQTKTAELFARNRRRADGLDHRCSDCQFLRYRKWFENRKQKTPELHKSRLRSAHLRFWFGLTHEEYEAMMASQNGLCAICGKPETRLWKGKPTRLAVDHDHSPPHTIRGLLCSKCNHGIGSFLDSPALLEAAAAYLRAHGKA